MSEASILIASGLISLTAHSINCWGKRKKVKKLYKTKLSSLIISKGCGKSTLKKSLSALTSDLVIVDMSSVVDSVDELEYLKKGKEYVDDLLKKFTKKRFLLLLSSKEESTHFGVDKDNTFVVCPSIDLFNNIIGDIAPQLTEYKTNIEKERLKLIKDTESDKLNIFASFKELYDVIKREYKLQSTF